MRRNLLLFITFLLTAACNRNQSFRVTTYAGSGAMGTANGKAAQAAFSNPMGVATDHTGNIYVADSRNNLIRKISADGMVTTLAGSGRQGSADGRGSSASFFFPVGIASGNDGNVYVADTHNSLIRKIGPDGTVTTIAGKLTPELKDHPDSLGRLDNPYGIAVGKDGAIYFTDWAKNVVRKISRDGKVVIVAGTGDDGAKDGPARSATFFLPEGIAVDDKGNLFVADTYNNIIRKIDAHGIVSTLAGKPGKRNKGSADGRGAAASFSHPCGIAVDKKGNVYVADVGNNKIRKITADGLVSTYAGTGARGTENGSSAQATFYQPFGVATDDAGNVYVADYQNNTIRKIHF